MSSWCLCRTYVLLVAIVMPGAQGLMARAPGCVPNQLNVQARVLTLGMLSQGHSIFL